MVELAQTRSLRAQDTAHLEERISQLEMELEREKTARSLRAQKLLRNINLHSSSAHLFLTFDFCIICSFAYAARERSKIIRFFAIALLQFFRGVRRRRAAAEEEFEQLVAAIQHTHTHERMCVQAACKRRASGRLRGVVRTPHTQLCVTLHTAAAAAAAAAAVAAAAAAAAVARKRFLLLSRMPCSFIFFLRDSNSSSFFLLPYSAFGFEF